MLRFEAIEKELTDLLTQFGAPRKVPHPEYPFWFLKNEPGLWEVSSVNTIVFPPKGQPSRATLIRTNAEGGFQPDVFQALANDESLRSRVIAELLESHFPQTLREDILQTLNLSVTGETIACKQRDAQFRDKILSAYEYQCAVCGFNVRIGQIVIALEAAHIKWHQAGGPDIHQNGLALCSLHHKLFDRGAFTIHPNHSVLISEQAYGTGGFDEHLKRYHKQTLISPIRQSYKPDDRFLKWHTEQVFLSPERE